MVRTTSATSGCDSMRSSTKTGGADVVGAASAEPADGLIEGGAGRKRQLEKIAARVDWTAFDPALGRTLSGAREVAFPCPNS
jgi:hypothetical protein